MTKNVSSSKQSRLGRQLAKIFAVSVAFALIVALFYGFNFRGGLSESQEVWGQFGDYFGGLLNPILALAALIALLKTIAIQSEELEHSRLELAKSASALQQQSESLKKQSFEQTFFHQLSLHHSIVDSLTTTDLQGPVSGRRCFTVQKAKLQSLFSQRVFSNKANLENNEESLRIVLRQYFDSADYMFDHYFSNLDGLLKFIETEAIGDNSKYFSVLQAQISSIEFGFLAYYRFLERDDQFSQKIETYFVFRPQHSSFVRPEHGEWVAW